MGDLFAAFKFVFSKNRLLDLKKFDIMFRIV
jgi:hypothetical protein